MTTDAATEALATARAALATAQDALRLAERAAGGSGAPADLGEITVERINVVEEDGGLRMVLGNSSLGRTVPLRGEPRDHPGRAPAAGLLFVNDDGTECGGLTFRGRREQADEPGAQSCYLAFDDVEQNEGVRIGLFRRGPLSERFVELVDQPSWSLVDLLDDLDQAADDDERAAVRRRYAEAGGAVSRVLVARGADGAARVVLRDGRGRDRIRLVVPEEGEPCVEVLGADGRVRSLVPPA